MCGNIIKLILSKYLNRILHGYKMFGKCEGKNKGKIHKGAFYCILMSALSTKVQYYTAELGYNDLGLCNTLPILLNILWY